MTKFITAFVGAFLLVITSIATPAQELSLKEKIEIGTNAIKLGCGLESRAIEVHGSADGAITLSKLPSGNAGAQIHFTSRETVGLIAAFQKEMTEAGRRLSEKQLACMQLYVDRIVGAVFPTVSDAERHDLRQACLATCDGAMDTCQTDETTKFSQCIENRRQRCLNACRNGYGFLMTQCISDLCNPENGSNKDDWPQVCRASMDVASCGSEKAICRRKCL